MKEPIRVLQVVTKMDRAGLETMLMNYYRHIDRSKIQFDFLTHRSERGAYDDEIESLGGKIYRTLPISPQYVFRYLKDLEQFFRDRPIYKIVHSHIDALSVYPLFAAKKAGTPIRISHSHTNNFDNDMKLPFRIISKSLIPWVATDFWGCSRSAIEFMFGKKIISSKKFIVLPNAIDSEKFKYNPNKRKDIRIKLRVDGKFVVGHIGRFAYPKNHEFLIDIFKEIHTTNPNSVLILVGEGEEKERILQKVKQLGLQNDVLFLGVRSDIPDLMQAMDVFLFPSRFEGLGVVLIEAQAAGLPCIASKDVIPEEVNVTGLVKFVSYDAHISKWREEILKSMNVEREDMSYHLKESGYDVVSKSHEMTNMYFKLLGEDSKAW